MFQAVETVPLESLILLQAEPRRAQPVEAVRGMPFRKVERLKVTAQQEHSSRFSSATLLKVLLQESGSQAETTMSARVEAVAELVRRRITKQAG
jgi:hypothetical protein